MQSSKRARKSRPPASREAAYRIIIRYVNEVCIQIRKFAKHYLNRDAIDYSACAKCLKDLCEVWETEPSKFPTWKEFFEKHKIKATEDGLRKKDSYKDLLNICERAREYELMIPGVREMIVECARGHLYKYCQSFIEEAEELEIQPVLEYEEAINAYRTEMDAKINKINKSILEYGEIKKPFETFISEGNVHAKLMEETCVLLIEVSHTAKKWIAEDSAYPDKLLQDIFFNNSYKEKLEDDIEKLRQKIRSTDGSIERKRKTHATLAREHSNHKRQKHRAKQSLEVVILKIQKLERDIEAKNKEIQQLKDEIADKTPVSPRYRSDLRLNLEREYGCLDKLEENKQVMERQKIRLDREFKSVNDSTYEYKVEAVTNRHEQHEMRQKMLGMEIEIKSIYDRISSIDQKSAVLKKIRLLNLSPDTLRMMHKRRIKIQENGDETSSNLGQLEEACKFVSNYIGKDWKKLYERLPFIPPRDPDRKMKDLEVIDRISAHRDRTPEESALFSLEKWRSFNRQCELGQLIKGLRKLNKVDLAEKIESRYAVEDVYG
ncbi:forkhead-associated domain-containing protein 1-like isoform X2 [Mytilus trossulus]|uniref:forkhead-associated domain-containing protein 1-like isoform X2 n=1 Tax=Mytilus trossulus TaxID=6551 RepID=UPI003005BBB2